MLPSHIGNRDPRPRGFLQDPQFLVDGIPSTALNTRINLNTLCIRRHSRMTRLTPSSYLRQHCPVEMGAAPVHEYLVSLRRQTHEHVGRCEGGRLALQVGFSEPSSLARVAGQVEFGGKGGHQKIILSICF
jgi:hypothetical protein